MLLRYQTNFEIEISFKRPLPNVKKNCCFQLQTALAYTSHCVQNDTRRFQSAPCAFSDVDPQERSRSASLKLRSPVPVPLFTLLSIQARTRRSATVATIIWASSRSQSNVSIQCVHVELGSVTEVNALRKCEPSNITHQTRLLRTHRKLYHECARRADCTVRKRLSRRSSTSAHPFAHNRVSMQLLIPQYRRVGFVPCVQIQLPKHSAVET
jgi:hypothetical protein